MKTSHLDRAATGACMTALFAIICAGSAGAGPLDPPAPPGSTDSVRLPGTPIGGPTTISAPGHYYLTRNIAVTGSQVAVTIAANDVSLDLGGFTIDGDDSAGSWGIRFTGSLENVTVSNGTIRDFQFGVDVPSESYRIILRNMNAISNVRGFSLLISEAVLSDCMASGNTETGIYLPGNRSVIRGCLVVGNLGDGITASGGWNLIESNKVENNSVLDLNVTSTFNLLRENLSGSIVIQQNANNVVVDNVCRSLTGAGGSNVTAATSHQNVGC